MSAKINTKPPSNEIGTTRTGRAMKQSSLPGLAIRTNARSVSAGLAVRNYSPGPYATATRTSLATGSSKVKARKVHLYRNGDAFFKGFTFAILAEKVRTFDTLLSEIGRCPVGDPNALPKGVRYVFSMAGKPVTQLEDFVDGHSYVCSSINRFRKINYRGIVGATWNNKAKPTESEIRIGASHCKQNIDCDISIQPRLVYVIRSGPRPRKKVRILLSKRTAQSFDQVLTMFAKAVEIESGIVRQLYTISGQQVTGLKDLFQKETVFIVYGHEKFSSDDLVMDSSETKFVQHTQIAARQLSQTRAATRSASSSRSSRQRAPKLSKCESTSQESASEMSAASQSTMYEQTLNEPQANESRYSLCQQLTDEEVVVIEQKRPTTTTSLQSARSINSAGSPTPRNPDAVCQALPCIVSSDGSIEPDSLQFSSSQSVLDSEINTGFEWPSALENKYEMGNILAESKCAVVRRCFSRDESDVRSLALKMISKGKIYDGFRTSLLFCELSILRRLKHDNLLELIDELDTPEKMYLVLPLIENGQDIYSHLSSLQEVYSERNAIKLLVQLCMALKYLHAINIVHRHVKPENCLVSSVANQQPILKLCDFGLAIELGPTPLYDICGTPSYMAPEMVRQTGYGSKVDVWAAGLVGCVLLTGTSPFFSDSLELSDVFNKISTRQCKLDGSVWDGVGQQAKDLIMFLLEDNIDARASAAIALEHPWMAENVGLQHNLLPTILSSIKLSATSVKKSVDAYLAVILATAVDRSSCYYRWQTPDQAISVGHKSATSSKNSTPRVGVHTPAHVSPAACSIVKSPADLDQKSARMSTKSSDVLESCHSKEDATKMKHVSPSVIAENGEGATSLFALEPYASASSSVEYASLCESLDTLHSAGDNWHMSGTVAD